MKKLADISQFESLMNNSQNAVFNGVFSAVKDKLGGIKDKYTEHRGKNRLLKALKQRLSNRDIDDEYYDVFKSLIDAGLYRDANYLRTLGKTNIPITEHEIWDDMSRFDQLERLPWWDKDTENRWKAQGMHILSKLAENNDETAALCLKQPYMLQELRDGIKWKEVLGEVDNPGTQMANIKQELDAYDDDQYAEDISFGSGAHFMADDDPAKWDISHMLEGTFDKEILDTLGDDTEETNKVRMDVKKRLNGVVENYINHPEWFDNNVDAVRESCGLLIAEGVRWALKDGRTDPYYRTLY